MVDDSGQKDDKGPSVEFLGHDCYPWDTVYSIKVILYCLATISLF